MPKPPLPDHLVKDVAIKVRFLKSEMKILLEQAKKRKCKTMSEYIRGLVKADISKGKGANGFPDIC